MAISTLSTRLLTQTCGAQAVCILLKQPGPRQLAQRHTVAPAPSCVTFKLLPARGAALFTDCVILRFVHAHDPPGAKLKSIYSPFNGSWPQQSITGRRGYFGKSGSMADRWQR